MIRPLFPIVAVVAAMAACGRERPAPPPASAAPADPAPLRPLTSRDTGTPTPGAVEGEAVEGEVRLHPRLTDKGQPDDVLYIIARGSANRQIVAVRKEEHVRFPFAFRLSSGDTMMPGTPFAGPFDLTARLSRSGDATPRPGDLEGTLKNVAAGSRGISVIVDTIRP